MTVDTRPEAMVRDAHPAEVLLPDGTLVKGCRVFITTRRLLAYGVNAEREMFRVVELERTDPTSVTASRNTMQPTERFEVETTEGVAYVNRGHGCGCHSPLKALAPPVPWSPR